MDEGARWSPTSFSLSLRLVTSRLGALPYFIFLIICLDLFAGKPPFRSTRLKTQHTHTRTHTHTQVSDVVTVRHRQLSWCDTLINLNDSWWSRPWIGRRDTCVTVSVAASQRDPAALSKTSKQLYSENIWLSVSHFVCSSTTSFTFTTVSTVCWMYRNMNHSCKTEISLEFEYCLNLFCFVLFSPGYSLK